MALTYFVMWRVMEMRKPGHGPKEQSMEGEEKGWHGRLTHE